jgi:hypothetical protein
VHEVDTYLLKALTASMDSVAPARLLYGWASSTNCLYETSWRPFGAAGGSIDDASDTHTHC